MQPLTSQIEPALAKWLPEHWRKSEQMQGRSRGCWLSGPPLAASDSPSLSLAPLGKHDPPGPPDKPPSHRPFHRLPGGGDGKQTLLNV